MTRERAHPQPPVFESLERRVLLDGWDGYAEEDIAYRHYDISGTGTEILDGVDDGSVPVNIGGKHFNYYEQSYTGQQVRVSPNGLISLAHYYSNWTNYPLAAELAADNIICPLWDDWYPYFNSHVYYEVRHNELIVQWDDMRHYWTSGLGDVTFVAVLELHNNTTDQSQIEFFYQDLSTNETGDDAGSATIGIKGPLDTDHVQHSYNEAQPDLQRAGLRYDPVRAPYVDLQIQTDTSQTPVPEPVPTQPLMPGDTIGTYWMKITNRGTKSFGWGGILVDAVARLTTNPTVTHQFQQRRFQGFLDVNQSTSLQFDLGVTRALQPGTYTIEFTIVDSSDMESTDYLFNNTHVLTPQFTVDWTADLVIRTDPDKTSVPEAGPGRVVLAGHTLGPYWMKLTNQGNKNTGNVPLTVVMLARSTSDPDTVRRLDKQVVTVNLRKYNRSFKRVKFMPQIGVRFPPGTYQLEFQVTNNAIEHQRYRDNNVNVTSAMFDLGGSSETFGDYEVDGQVTRISNTRCTIKGTTLVPVRIAGAEVGRTYRVAVTLPAGQFASGIGHFETAFRNLPMGARLLVSAKTDPTKSYVYENVNLWRNRIISSGQLSAEHAQSNRIVLYIKIDKLRKGETAADIDLTMAIRPKNNASTYKANKLLDIHKRPAWVGQALGL